MTTLEEALTASMGVQRMDAELKQLIRILEADPYWQARGQFSEPTKSDLIRVESGIVTVKSAMHANALAHATILESSENIRQMSDMGMSFSLGVEEAFETMTQGAATHAEGFIQVRDGLASIINQLRSLRGEPPLTGAESISN